MNNDLGSWLREERQARGWAKAEMARRIVQAGRDNGDTTIPGAASMLHNIHRWEREGGVSERHKLHYCRAFGIPPSQFGPQPAEAQPDGSRTALALTPSPAVDDPHLPTAVIVAYRGNQEPGLRCFTVEQEVSMAAHEASDHAEEYEQHGIGEATFEQLRADLTRLSRLSDIGTPFDAFMDMRRVRSRIYRLLDRQLWPGEQTDLHFMLACINGLMGVTATRLGYPDAAEELIRAGYASATAIDHRSLRGMLRAKLSDTMYWRGWYKEGRDAAADGLRYISSGSLGADLHLNHARAAARLGDLEAARRSVGLAHDAQASDHRDDLAEIGGEEFRLSRATQHGIAGAALAGIKDGEQEAAEELEGAISLYDNGPGPGEQHWFGGKALASIDLALVRLRLGALDAASSALEPVLILPVPQRVSAMTTRLARVRDELASPVFRHSARAGDLDDQIEDFSRDAVTAGLHSLSG